MSVKNAGSKINPGRRLLRMTLAFSLASMQLPLHGQTDWEPIPGASVGLPQSMSMPAFDLQLPSLDSLEHSNYSEPASHFGQSPSTARSSQLLKRWLGMVAKESNASRFPQSGLSNQVSEHQSGDPGDVVWAGFTEESTSSDNPSNRFVTGIVADGRLGLSGQQVIQISATDNGTRSVLERFSDRQGAAGAASEEIDANDLMNSLDLGYPAETLSSEEQGLVQSEPIKLQFTDSHSKSNPTSQHQLRSPQLVRPGRGMTVGVPGSEAGTSFQLDDKNSMPSASAIPNDNPEPINVPASREMIPLETAELSSRRRAQPKAMNIQIEGVDGKPIQLAQRPPLVGLLESVPNASSSDEAPAATLMQLMYAEDGRLPTPMVLSSGGSRESLPTALEPIVAEPITVEAIEDEPAELVLTVEEPAPVGLLPQASILELPTEQPVAEQLPEIPTTLTESSERVDVMVRKLVNLKAEHHLSAVSSEHEDICQVIQLGPRNFSVIGLSEGVTRIALISEDTESRQIEIRQVRVSNGTLTGGDLSLIADNVGQSIQQLYPSSSIQIAARGHKLVVSGRVDSDATARRILSLVRKMALIPVVDELKTY